MKDLHILCSCEVTLIAFLQHYKLIKSEVNCEVCFNPCNIYLLQGELFFRCRRRSEGRPCSFARSVKEHTWFENCKLTFEQIFEFFFSFIANLAVNQTSFLFNISNTTIVDYFNFCREICVEFCLRQTEAIGGPGTIVEIDESKFGKRKYNRGKRVEGQWVFGGVQRDSNDCFFVPVASRDSETLVSIIKTYIKPGTTIISDYWKAYDCLTKEGYEYLTVNHSVCFKDPHIAAHTNTIESLWSAVK